MVRRPRAGEVEHPLAHDVLEAEVCARELRPHGDRYGRAEAGLVRVDRDIGQLDAPAGGAVDIAQRTVSQTERRKLERGPPLLARRVGGRLRLPLAASERADVQPSRAVAHETHDGFVDDDAIDDETPPEERDEPQPHAEPPRGEERLCRVEGGVVADRDPLEGNAETAAEGEAEALGAELSPERVPRRSEQPALLAARQMRQAGDRARGGDERHRREGHEPASAHSPSS